MYTTIHTQNPAHERYVAGRPSTRPVTNYMARYKRTGMNRRMLTPLISLLTLTTTSSWTPSASAAPLLTTQDAGDFSPSSSSDDHEARVAFAVLDTDDSSTLSREELDAGLRALQSPLTAEELQALFDRAQPGINPGQLRFDEFAALLHEAS